MKKVIRLTENDLTRIVRRVIQENEDDGCEHLTGRMAMAFNESRKGSKYGEPKMFHELRTKLGEILDVALDKDCSNTEELIKTKNNYLYLMALRTGEIEPHK